MKLQNRMFLGKSLDEITDDDIRGMEFKDLFLLLQTFLPMLERQAFVNGFYAVLAGGFAVVCHNMTPSLFPGWFLTGVTVLLAIVMVLFFADLLSVIPFIRRGHVLLMEKDNILNRLPKPPEKDDPDSP